MIAGQLGVEVSAVAVSASFVDDLGADSLDRVELITALEETYDLKFADQDAENISTVQDAIEIILRKMPSR